MGGEGWRKWERRSKVDGRGGIEGEEGWRKGGGGVGWREGKRSGGRGWVERREEEGWRWREGERRGGGGERGRGGVEVERGGEVRWRECHTSTAT